MPPEVSQDMPAHDEEEENIKNLKAYFGTDSVWRYQNQRHAYMLSARAYQYRKGGKYGLAFGNTMSLMQPLYDSVTYVMNIDNNNSYLPKKSHYLLAVKKDGKFGLINEGGEEILPFQYDFTGPLPNWPNAFELRKNGKVGVFIPNTFYPLIPTAYDALETAVNIKVNNGWSFLVFKVIKNGRTGYVGENGVEFFK